MRVPVPLTNPAEALQHLADPLKWMMVQDIFGDSDFVYFERSTLGAGIATK